MTRAAPADDDTRPSGVPVRSAAAPAGFGAVVGALGGVAFGFFAGPVGMLIGGLLGAIGGAGLGDAVSTMQAHRSFHDDRVDEELGVIDGNIGAAPADQEAPWIGAYSLASAGGASFVTDTTPDEGPIPKSD